jgi:hypothetical protein
VCVHYGELPLSLEANQGQTDAWVKFCVRGHACTLFLISTEAGLVLSQPQERPSPARSHAAVGSERTIRPTTVVLRIHLRGAHATPLVTPLEELPGKSLYVRGRNPQRWLPQIPHYGKVRYAAVYSTIDLVYYGSQRQRELVYLASHSWSACDVLEKIPLLYTHYLGVIRKGYADASRIRAVRYAGHR